MKSGGATRTEFAIAVLLLFAIRSPFLLWREFFDGDEAVTGLMGLAVQRGEFAFSYWGSGYPSGLESMLTAIPLWVIPSSRIATKLVPLTVHLLTVMGIAWLVWRATLAPRAALAVICVAALLPAPITMFGCAAVGRSLTPMFGTVMWMTYLHGAGASAGLLFGLAFGLGYWNEPTILIPGVPLGVLWVAKGILADRFGQRWLARHSKSAAWFSMAALGTLTGFSPHLYAHWVGRSLGRPHPEIPRWSDVLARMRMLAFEAYPGAITIDVAPGSGGSHDSAWIWVGAVVVSAWFGWLIVRAIRAAMSARGRTAAQAELVFCSVITVGLLVAGWCASPTIADYMSRRYLVFVWPAMITMAGLGFWALARARYRTAVSLSMVMYLVTAMNVRLCARVNAARKSDCTTLISFLEQQGIRGGFANYWVSNLVSLETRERLLVAQHSSGAMRHASLFQRLDGMRGLCLIYRPSLYPEDAVMLLRHRAGLSTRGIHVRSVETDGWIILIPVRGRIPLDMIKEARSGQIGT